MPLIDGVGDEVVQFMAVILVILVAALAWWSTNARPVRYRAVLVMHSRSQNPFRIRTRRHSLRIATQNSLRQSSVTNPVGSNLSETTDESRRENRVIPLREMDSIVDADVAMINHNRLHFYRRIDTVNSNTQDTVPEPTSEESESQEDTEPASNAQIREMDSIVSAMEADGAAIPFTRADENTATDNISAMKDSIKHNKTPATNLNPADDSVVTENNTSDPESSSEALEQAGGDAGKILIKLKYLNDTLKEVDGSLDELLKDFKCRHFSTELSSESRVRLIFNGRVLVDDAATLRACGLHDRAVVHCLVHPSRPAAQRVVPEEPALSPRHEIVSEGGPQERTWDLENILMTLISVALTVVWFFRCEYSNMFTASASVALFGLTVFYSVAIFGLYLTDRFHFDRRPAPAVPNN